MSRVMLEEIVKVFDRYKEDWTNIDKENEHKQVIQKVAKMENLEELFFEFIDDEEKKIRMQIFLIFIESQDKSLIIKLIEWLVVDYKRLNNYNTFFGYLSDESFYFFYDIFKEVGFFKTNNHTRLSIIFLDYFILKSDDSFIEDFYEIVINDNKFYGEVFDVICFFPKAKEILLQEYYYRDKKYFKYENVERGDSIGWTFLLQKNEFLAFNCLRNYDTLTNSHVYPEDAILNLNMYGNKQDGRVILDAIEYGMKNGILDKEGKRLFKILEPSLKTVTNPILLNGLIKYFRLYSYRLKHLLHTALHIQYNEVINQEFSGHIGYVLSRLDIYSKDIIERRLTEIEKADKELISSEYLFNYWNKIIKEFSHVDSCQQRKSFYTGNAYSIKEELIAYSEEGTSFPSAQLENLIIYTGQYFPLDYTGYYSKIKAQLGVWEKYIDENIEKFEDGRWIRYGKYVD